MHIDELLHQVAHNPAELILPKDWTQGRTAFGGISAAMVYQAMREQVEPTRFLRSLTINFVGPLEPEVPFSIETELLREGKNAIQMTARAMQNGKVAVLGVALFAGERQSKISVPAIYSHNMALPKKAKFIPQIPKVTPKFLKHMDLAVEEGQMPFTGSKHAHLHGWMRFTKAPAQISDAHIIALADAWPPAPLQMLRWPAPASSMSWNLEFVHPHRPIAPESWLAYQVQTVQAADGYAHTEAQLWDPDGELIALSRQVAGIFD
ncbi:acyl-CoA thioesterase II [Bowmanella sp. JS7-9]|uniref:Acyl-CoA thioesterase n=1 Tax=Pseudobowmanella zhangzhouensis TaxID=1537679 RepID=A0ABW1XLC1_9ALTE|nr:thioesterase family protein [Bowmanella sp. JS7-9]TBX22030.1 acyl-CoA thioesterase [Bowmanella sp. JS7-9]